MTLNRLSAYAPQILAITRILIGVSFVTHGAQKLLGAFGGLPSGVPVFVVWGAGSIELLGGSLLVLGWLSRPAAFVSSGLMAAAYFMAHAPQGLWPIANGGELAVVYCWLFLYFAAHGPGAWALDNVRASRKNALLRAA